MFFLQTPIVPSEDVTARVDSLKQAVGSFAETLATDPEAALHQLVHDGIEFGLKVLAALAIYIVGAWIIRRVKKAQKKRFERRHTDPTLASFTQSFTSVVLTVLILVLAISALGINTTSLAALLAAGGMAIGMALSGTLQNFAGGIMLLAFKPFRVGDFIEAQGYSGTVTELTIVSTHITLPDNRRVILPNGVLSNGSINNYTRNPLRRIEWNIGFAYGVDEKACIEKLLELLRSDPHVLDSSTPGASDPFAAVGELSASAVVFKLRGWVKSEDYWDVWFNINNKIYSEMPKAGFDFPFPQLDLHIKN